MTGNHGYNTPTEGETNWHIPVNENFESLDRDVEIRDTRDSLSAYEPKEDAKFLATDTGAIFIGDGSTWNRVASSGPEPEFRSIAASEINTVRIAETAQDIQDLHDEFGGTGTLIRLKAKTYDLSTLHDPPLTLRQGVRIQGLQSPLPRGGYRPNEQITVLNAGHLPDGSTAIETAPNTVAKHGHGAGIENVVITGNGRNIDLLDCHGTGNVYTKGIIVTDTLGHGIRWRGMYSCEMENTFITSCGSRSKGTHALQVTSDGNRNSQIRWRRGKAIARGRERNTLVAIEPGGRLFANQLQLKLFDAAGVPIINNADSLSLSNSFVTSEFDELTGIADNNTTNSRYHRVIVEKVKTGYHSGGGRGALLNQFTAQRCTQDGIVHEAHGRGKYVQVLARENGRDGIRHENTRSGPTCLGCRFRNNGGYGVRFASGAGSMTVHASRFVENTSGAINDPGKIDLAGIEGVVHRNHGVETQSGDGSTAAFSIAHGLDFEPEVAHVTPLSEAAGGQFWQSGLDLDAIHIEYASPPPSGIDNLRWTWTAEV